MPLHFIKRMRAMKTIAAVELICTILVIILIGLTVEVLLAGSNLHSIWTFLTIGSICILIIILSSKCGKKMAATADTYEIVLSKITTDSVITAFSAAELAPDAYITFHKRGKYSIRMLIQTTSRFEKTSLSNRRKKLNRTINAKFHITSSLSMYEALSNVRINLVVCECDSTDLQKYLRRDIGVLLARNEIIIPAAICLDKHVLILPDCPASLTLNQLNRYETAAKFLCDGLKKLRHSNLDKAEQYD